MFRAIDLVMARDVVILDVTDKGQLEALREKGRLEQLQCPGCQQAVLVRAGAFKRPHFAHRHLRNCPLSQDSMELLEARAALYQWLQSKFPEEVSLERQLPDARMPRAVDCWVEHQGRQFAYWIADRRIKPEDRVVIQQAVTAAGASLNFVLHIQMMERSAATKGAILLTTTERDFVRRTRFDATYSPQRGGDISGSLHYLDPERLSMTTFRGLELVESPQRFRGWEVCTPLSALLVLPSTGEIAHPGEQSRLDQWISRKREERRRLERQKQEEERLRRAAKARPTPMSPANPEVPRMAERLVPRYAPEPLPPAPPKSRAPVEAEPEGICEYCGEKTRDWVVYRGASGMCQCRRCVRAKQQAMAKPASPNEQS